MRYVSTRGKAPAVSAAEALLAGQAPDGGLYVPEVFPSLPGGAEALVGLTMPEILGQLLEIFFGELGPQLAARAAQRCQDHFGDEPIAALKQVGQRWVLELFHGPTAAFKDVALGTLPELLRVTLLQHRPVQRLLVLTATSGDTGSAALHGLGGSPGIGTLVFYPAHGISELQRRQMVCCSAAGIRPVALHGDFDDAQRAVKALLSDRELAQTLADQGIRLGSANSINIGRLVPQVAYHLWAWAELRRLGVLAAGEPMESVVPSGNFGNLLSAWWARRLGAPLQRLGCASNANRVLADFWETGRYDARRALAVTNSPSMDILVSSNLERLLAEALDDPAALGDLQDQLKTSQCFQASDKALQTLRQTFYGGWVSQEETVQTMAEVWRQHRYLLDPHTAVAWTLAQRQPASLRAQLVVATASPWKFTGALTAALGLEPSGDEQRDAQAAAAATGEQPPPALRALWQAPVLHQRSCDIGGTLGEVLDFAQQPW
jgi:threonine synthase